MQKSQDYTRELITIFFVQVKLILAVMVVFVIGGILIAFFWPPTYSADGSILLKAKNSERQPESLEKINLSVPGIRPEDLFSEMSIITSNEVMRTTIERLEKNKKHYLNSMEGANTQTQAMRTLLKSITTELVPRSNVFKVSLIWSDPNIAEELLRTIMEEYVKYRGEIYTPEGAKEFFSIQLNHFNNELEQSENKLIELAEESNTADPGAQIQSNLLHMKNIENQITEMSKDLEMKKSEIEYLSQVLRSSKANFLSFSSNLALSDFGKKLQDAVIEREKLLRVYQKESPNIRRIDEEIQSIYNELKAEAGRYLDDQRSRIEGQKIVIKSMQKRLGEIESENVKLYKAKMMAQRVGRKVTLLQDSYDTFAKRFEEARINNTTDANRLFTVSVLSWPAAAVAPVFPNKINVILLGLILGFLVGITIGFIREFFDHRFKRPEDVMKNTELESIFSIRLWA